MDMAYYIFLAKPREIHPAPLFSLPHPAAEPSPERVSVIVNTPAPVNCPVVEKFVPGPVRMFRLVMSICTLNAGSAEAVFSAAG